MGGQLDGNFLPGSLPHKFILIVTSIICFLVNKFLNISTLSADGAQFCSSDSQCYVHFYKCSQQHPPFIRPLYRSTCVSRHAPPVKNWRIFVGAKFYCPHALADGNQRIRREKTLEFSSTALSTLSLYKCLDM